MRKLLTILALLQAMALPATAATLEGDSVTIHLFAEFSWGTYTRTVGPGEDGDISSLSYDLNAGPDGDLFTLRSKGAYCGLNCSTPPTPVVWTLLGLDFVGGQPLTDFEIVQGFSDATVSFTDSSVTITYTDDSLSPGIFFQGRFVTEPLSAVPLPASFPLVLAGLGGLGLLRRKQRRSQLSS
ncbi:VPLPA-CTERM sorting domain-containing protein [Poseidonocella sedimentorum]|uniref:VPLPA-CTERM protein sorting domain-containing protein n=1 Tax=Poseidonocella sedimentorum TaxID=871652 RepID=A0A1I6D9X2_9RHOB|nr:VPLPA-CTERM sorting domain-containing protein [Poseidonocella sedimentorum]SFR02266.1 VPLPA-CTERM protein sorting domain-containing protein [Poseidonocella sedimentorum]